MPFGVGFNGRQLVGHGHLLGLVLLDDSGGELGWPPLIGKDPGSPLGLPPDGRGVEKAIGKVVLRLRAGEHLRRRRCLLG